MVVAPARSSAHLGLGVALAALFGSAPCPAQGTATEIASFPCGADTDDLIDLFGIAVFSIGDEMWRTDGTVAGTFQLATRQLFGPTVERPVRMGDHVYFTSWDAPTGEELWRTDGTLAGTVMVRDYLPGHTSLEPRELTPVGRYLVFRGQTPPAGGLELYVSDGTFQGTHLLRDILPGAGGSSPRQFAKLGNRVVFLADDGTHGNEFWVTDGTPAGTALVTDSVPGSAGIFPYFMGAIGDRTLWVDGAYSNVRLLGTDATAAGTTTLHAWPAQLAAFSPLAGFVEVAGRSYFTVAFYHGSNNTSHELWSTNGLPGGTIGHGQIWPPAYRTGNPEPQLWSLGSRLMYERETAAAGREPWIFDPGTGQSTLVADFAAGTASSRVTGVVSKDSNAALVLVSAPVVKTVWTIDPTAATAPIALRSAVDSLMPIGSRYVWFVGDDGALGYEFWRTDGTVAGTQRVGGNAVPGPAGVWVDQHVLSGGRLIVLGDHRLSANSHACGPRVWAVEPAAHTVALGDPGAGAAGSARLTSSDPVLGATMQLRLEELDAAPLFAVTFDAYSNRATWLDFWFYSGFTAPQVLTWGAAAGGTGSLSLPLPSDPAFQGVRLQLQGFGLGAPELLPSNGLLLVLGN